MMKPGRCFYAIVESRRATTAFCSRSVGRSVDGGGRSIGLSLGMIRLVLPEMVLKLKFKFKVYLFYMDNTQLIDTFTR